MAALTQTTRPNVILASKTLAAIEEGVARDQGDTFRSFLQKVIPHIGDAYRTGDDAFRSHLGASTIAQDCGRAIWYDFNWATEPRFSGRMMRLFNRGHLEEARFIALLLMIGVQVYQQDANGKQYRISSYGGHFGGSGDGVGIGIPDLPAGLAALLEFKTHNDDSFKTLKKEGVYGAKLEHYVQMQMYLKGMGLTVALYLAVNKNTDEIYGEIVPVNTEIGETFYKRAHKIIPMRVAPDKIKGAGPGWFACKWCDHKDVCHLKVIPARNCRTCKHSMPKEDGKWWCENKERQMTMLFGPKPGISNEGETFELSKQRQLSGCSMYELNTTSFGT